MNQQQATEFIIHELNKGHSPEAITWVLCEQTGWPRASVALFVRQVESRQRQSAVKTTPQPSPEPARPASGDAARPSAPQPSQRPPRPAKVKQIEQHQELAEHVIRELGQHRDHNSLIRELCEAQKWSWKEAHRFVRMVEIKHGDRIAARQTPLMVFLGVGMILVGLVIVVATAFMVIDVVTHPETVSAERAENTVYYAAGFLTGLGMVVGGIAGIWRTISLARE